MRRLLQERLRAVLQPLGVKELLPSLARLKLLEEVVDLTEPMSRLVEVGAGTPDDLPFLRSKTVPTPRGSRGSVLCPLVTVILTGVYDDDVSSLLPRSDIDGVERLDLGYAIVGCCGLVNCATNRWSGCLGRKPHEDGRTDTPTKLSEEDRL